MTRRFKSLEHYLESLFDIDGEFSTIPPMHQDEYVMPDINLNENSYSQKCHRCGRVGFYDRNEVGVDIGLRYRDIHGDFFYTRPFKDWMNKKYCDGCYEFIIPYIMKLVDISELEYYVGFLNGCISDKRRAKHNGSTTNDACERRKRRIEWGLGNRPRYCDSQTREEYQRLVVFGDKNSDVLTRDSKECS